MKKVIITGILGQDGANMAEHILLKTDLNCKVYGMMRRSANPNFINTKKFKNHPYFEFVYGDLSDEISIDNIIKKVQPDYFINFGANSFVGCSWDMPLQVMDVNALGVLRCLESIRKFKKDCRFYSAGSSEEWGDVDYSPQDIDHKIKPRSPYGASKAAARHLVKVYRESYGIHAVHGILFNHEGTKRGEEFVTRKITKNVARLKKALDFYIESENQSAITPMELGNLDAKRDWSDSEDFVEGVWLMMNQDSPKDYILSSGETHSIREFVEKAFAFAGISGEWKGEGLEEEFGVNLKGDWITLLKINKDFFRPAEVDLLLGDSTPIKKDLGWKPKNSFSNLVKKMVQHDLNE